MRRINVYFQLSWVSLLYRQASSVVVVHYFQISSSQKLLSQSKPNFLWRVTGMGEQKFVQMILVTWPRWPPCPYIVKTLQKIFFFRTTKQMTLKLGIQHWGLISYKVCSNDDPGLTLTYARTQYGSKIYVKARSNLLPNAFVWETA